MASRSRSFNRFSTSSCFYANLCIQESLTTIGYGIEARKGLVLVTGEAGIGKSRLLQKVSSKAGANIIYITAADPRLTFTDILRLILLKLDAESARAEESTMLHNCRLQLRARLMKQQIVALILDNAQHLADSTLNGLVNSFLATDPTNADGYLLQVVLVGRPQLRDKLLRASRLSAALKFPVLCELHPLDKLEIVTYVEAGLRASALPLESFETNAVEPIAQYSHGNPSRINAICDRALQLCSGGSTSKITNELIDLAAKDLGLRMAEVGGRQSTPNDFRVPAEQVDPAEFQLGEKDTTKVVGETFLDYTGAYNRDGELRSGQRSRRIIGTFIALVVVAGAGAWLRSGAALNPLDYWRETLSGIVLARHHGGTEITTVAPTQPAPELGGEATAPKTRETASDAETQAHRSSDIGQFETDDHSARVAADTPSSSSVAKPTAAQRPPIPHKAPLGNEALEHAVSQAIEKRAIDGVSVSVNQGTVILGGRVASERQRSTVERAVRNVNGVKHVRNQINVNYD